MNIEKMLFFQKILIYKFMAYDRNFYDFPLTLFILALSVSGKNSMNEKMRNFISTIQI